jgi:hypothetical protein
MVSSGESATVEDSATGEAPATDSSTIVIFDLEGRSAEHSDRTFNAWVT